MIKTDVLQTKMHGEISTGHNSLAAFIYFLTFLAFCSRPSPASRSTHA